MFEKSVDGSTYPPHWIGQIRAHQLGYEDREEKIKKWSDWALGDVKKYFLPFLEEQKKSGQRVRWTIIQGTVREIINSNVSRSAEITYP